MENPKELVHANSLVTFWIGVRSSRSSLELALIDRNAQLIDRVEVANDPRASLKVVRHWIKKYDLKPAETVFCAEDRGPWAGEILELLIARGCRVALVDTSKQDSENLPDALQYDAVGLVHQAMRAPIDTEPLLPIRLNAAKLKRLRERRERMLLLRTELESQQMGSSRQSAEELQREFERMDRRHIQLIDKLINRIDALITLQIDR